MLEAFMPFAMYVIKPYRPIGKGNTGGARNERTGRLHLP